jgi:hypothetical protein
MAGTVTQMNTLQAGALGNVDKQRTSSPKYGAGCEIAENCIPFGGVLTKAPGFGPLSALTYRAQLMSPPDQTYYMRNSVAPSNFPEQATLPNDLGVAGAQTLDGKFYGAIAAGNFLARTAADDRTGYYRGPFLGTPTAFWLNSDTTTIVQSSVKIPHVRAFSFTVDGETEWGVVCRKIVTRDVTHYLSEKKQDILGLERKEDPITLVMGRGFVSSSTTETFTTENVKDPVNPFYSVIVYTVSIVPLVFYSEVPLGWLKTPSADLKMVGTMDMFYQAPSALDHSSTATIYSWNGLNSKVVTVSTAGHNPVTDGLEDCYVINWGTAGAFVSSLDDLVQGKDTPWTTGFANPNPAAGFYFLTNREIVVGNRRIGKAMWADTTASTSDDRSIGLGAAGGTGAAGQGNNRVIGTISDTSPWFLSFDSPPQWYEQTYNGLIVGTSLSEYQVSNEQITKSLGLRRISSTGTHLMTDDRVAISAQINGNIVFCTFKGIAVQTYSTERQQFLPQLVETVNAGYGRPMSICSSKRYGLIFAYTDAGIILALNPETGAMTTMTVPERVFGGLTYRLYGLDTVDGEPRLVWINDDSGRVWAMCGFYGETRETMTVRTSRFGAFTGKRGMIGKAYLYLSRARGGRVRVGAGAYQARPFGWIEIPYTDAQVGVEVVNGRGYFGQFTGVVSLSLTDSPDTASEGKAIEVQFGPGEPVDLIGIGVEIKET